MTRTQGIGSLAAIGGLTALIALQTGLPAAKADEMADLRANQQLLQQRIDQLAQAQAQQPPAPGGIPGGGPGSAYGTAPTPGSGTTAGSFPRSFLIPGTDTSIRVGGFVDLTVLDFLQGGGAVPGSNYGSNSGQNGNLQVIPLSGGFVPGAPGGFCRPFSVNRAPSRNNGVLEFSPQQSRFNVETRTPTSWGEARTFFEMDWAGCDNFSCQTLGQGGGNSLVPRLRYAYGTLGGFLAGQAISNFSDADADTESMEFGGAEGSTGGMRIPQVRYTFAGPYGTAFSVSAENPYTTIIQPGGVESSDLNLVRHRDSEQSVSATAGVGVAVQWDRLHRYWDQHYGGDLAGQPGCAESPHPHGRRLFFAALGACQLRGCPAAFTMSPTASYQPTVRWAMAAISPVTSTLTGSTTTRMTSCSALSPGNGIGDYASGGDKDLVPAGEQFCLSRPRARPRKRSTCTGLGRCVERPV